jgi:hypothetical protein
MNSKKRLVRVFQHFGVQKVFGGSVDQILVYQLLKIVIDDKLHIMFRVFGFYLNLESRPPFQDCLEVVWLAAF